MMTKKLFIPLFILGMLLGASTACKRFVFGEVVVNDEDNPLIQKKVPRTGADLFVPPVVTTQGLPNPDAGGAFDSWATCLIMFKEGHPHGGGKLHGNYVYAKAPWRQEQFAVVHNTPAGLKVEVDRESVQTYIEKERGKVGPDYFRIIGGRSKLWGLCFYFYDKAGRLINEKILEQSEQYQIFFSISDLNDKGEAYDVLDVRYTEPNIEHTVSPYFQTHKTFEQRRVATPNVFLYTYRDTWLHDDMADGVRELFNLKLLPPYTRKTYLKARNEDIDCIGLKGHVRFDFDEPENRIDIREDWPIGLTRDYPKVYSKATSLLPHFYMAIRVLKCPAGKKAIIPKPQDVGGDNRMMCAPYNAPHEDSQWRELFRMNIPIRVYTSTFDTDPTNDDPNEPYFVHLGKEMGLSPKEAYDAITNIIIHGSDGSGGTGYGAWFL